MGKERKLTTPKTVRKSAERSPVVRLSRKIPDLTRLQLFVRAGGRCEFDGCNKFLLEHPLTLTEGNFAEMAHIVAFSADGPRGGKRRPGNIHDLANLMLLCPACHKEIDDHPDRYPVRVLEKYKERHEERIRHVTGLGPDQKTTIVQLKSRIAGQVVAIPVAQVTNAVAPRYPTDAKGCVIDLTEIEAEGEDFLKAAATTIKQRIERLYDRGMDVEQTRHVSLFALAPIPLLIYLGRQLSSKVPVDAFQRHRDTEDWVWKPSGTSVEYRFTKVRGGSDRTKVALLLALSGPLHLESLPKEIDVRFTIYELTLDGITPSPTFLRQRQDLDRFKEVYQGALRAIARDHGQLDEIHLFPAVPAPVAVHCGRELLPKVDPNLLVYDYDKRTGGFALAMKVNSP